MKKFCALCLLCLLSVACEYKELCYDHGHWVKVRVDYNWSDVPRPKPMTVLFYDQLAPSREAIRYDLANTAGDSVRLDPSTYQAVVYNYDTETILLRSADQLSTLEAYTRESSIEEGTEFPTTRSRMPRGIGTEEEPVILEPDTLYSAASSIFELVLNDTTKHVLFQPQERVVHVNITLHNVPNIKYTQQFGGSLSGLAPSVFLSSGVLGEGAATQAFPCKVVNDSTLQMNFRIFGHCPHFDDDGTYNGHILMVYAILGDGSKWYYTEDVTTQMHDRTKNPLGSDIQIDLEGLPVPKPIVNGSGFQPTIDGWQGIEIDVGM